MLLACVGWLGISPARADEREFAFGSTSLVLGEVTTNTAVYFTSMRLNRAANVWNVEVSVSNRSSQVLTGPIVLLADTVAGSTGLQQSDGLSGGKAYVDLSAQLSGGILLPGQISAKANTVAGDGNGNAVGGDAGLCAAANGREQCGGIGADAQRCRATLGRSHH